MTKERIREIDKKLERKEREKRKNNIVIRGIEMKDGKRLETVEEIMRKIGVRDKLAEVRRLGGEKEKERENVVVKLGSEENKKEVREIKGS